MQQFITLVLALLGLLLGIRVFVVERGGPHRAVPLVLFVTSIASIFNESQFETRGRILIDGLLCIALAALAPFLSRSRLPTAGRAKGAKDASLAFVALPLWLFAVDAVVNSSNSTTDTIGRLLPAVIVALLIPALRAAELQRESVARMVMGGFAFSLLLGLVASAPWSECTSFKCGQFHGIYQSAFSSGNYIGAVGGLVVVCAFVVDDRALRYLGLASGVLALVATDSRTSQLATLVALGFMLLIRLAAPVSATLWSLRGVIAPGMSFLGLWIVYTSSTTAFSDRGGIWKLGRDAVGDHWVAGRGLTSWSSDVLARNYMHSQSLLLLYGGGVVAVAIYALCAHRALVSAGRCNLIWTYPVVIFVLFRGLTEISWNALAFDGSTFLVLPLLLLAGTTQPEALARPAPMNPGARQPRRKPAA